MVRHKKQYSTMGMVDNKQNVKVKEEEDENISTKEKRKQNKAEGGKKAKEKQNSSKMDKNKEEKEKKMRVVDKKNDEKWREDRRKRKENEKKVKSHMERKEENENEKEEQGQREIEKEKVEEQKEINKHKGRKGEEHSKERDKKDQNDKKNCPHFFRALISYSFMEHVTIPVGFHKYLEDCTGMVSLRGPSGNKWPVELAKISGELCFARGWKEFLSDNRIGYGYLLVFRYDGQSQFSLTVFLPSSCEAPYASLAQPQRKDIDVAGKEEIGLMSSNADGTAPQEEDAHTGTSADGTPQNEASEEEDTSGDEEAEEVEDALSETPENEEDSECRMCSDDALEPTQQQLEDLRKTDDGFVVGKRARFRKVDDIMAEVDQSKKSKPAEWKNFEGPSGDPSSGGAASSDSLTESEHRPPKKSKVEKIRSPSGDSPSKAAASSDNFAELDSRPSKESKAEGKSYAPLIVYTRSSDSASKRVPLKKASEETISNDNLAVHTGVFAPESVCTDLTMWHNSFGKRFSKQNQFPMFNKSNGENQPGRVLIKVIRRLGLTSQRRPVTQREKEYAMERAQRFKSERPFTIKAMKHNNVYASYFMIIPDKFVKTFLPKKSGKMTLWDPQAKPWKVWYEYTDGERPRAAFSAGWGALAMENNLEKWDVCVFELLDQEYNIKLHVHKVVLMITPCVLAPKPRTYK